MRTPLCFLAPPVACSDHGDTRCFLVVVAALLLRRVLVEKRAGHCVWVIFVMATAAAAVVTGVQNQRKEGRQHPPVRQPLPSVNGRGGARQHVGRVQGLMKQFPPGGGDADAAHRHSPTSK